MRSGPLSTFVVGGTRHHHHWSLRNPEPPSARGAKLPICKRRSLDNLNCYQDGALSKSPSTSACQSPVGHAQTCPSLAPPGHLAQGQAPEGPQEYPP